MIYYDHPNCLILGQYQRHFNQLIEIFNLLINTVTVMAKTASKSNSNKKKRARLSQKGTAGRSGPRSVGRADPSTRQTLMQAAKKLFARQGLSGTSIRDIAHEAGMNSSMISYYFDGKDGLYRACLEEIATTRLQFTREILIPPKTLDEYKLRLRMFAESLVQAFSEDRETGLIVIREYDRINSPAEKVFKENFLKLFEMIIDFFREAQKKTFIDPHWDPFILASLFFGALSSQLRLDHIKEKTYGRSLKTTEEREKLCLHLTSLFSTQTA